MATNLQIEYSPAGIPSVKEKRFVVEGLRSKQEHARRWAVEHARDLSRKREIEIARALAEQVLAISQYKQLTEAKSIELKFQSLAEQWRKDTAHLSSITKQVIHPSYQRIIGLGPAVLPILLSEAARQSGYWFWALNAIAGEDPVDPSDLGNVQKMSEAWLRWGKQRGVI
ncbi:MAG TPA: hypothetical protein VGN86_00230 [Pyrinomonadaceae bacterium]|jgi:hypothetical protein|nr:hypothetical protein [Pyrinomonadaceae bacterium]